MNFGEVISSFFVKDDRGAGSGWKLGDQLKEKTTNESRKGKKERGQKSTPEKRPLKRRGRL